MAWSKWSGDIDAAFKSGPTVSSWAAERLDLFGRGLDDQLWHVWSDRPSKWQGKEGLGGALVDAPAVVSWGRDRIDVVARGTDNQGYHSWWNGSEWLPKDRNKWEPLGGALNSAPSIASRAPDRLDVFARGSADELLHKWWDGAQWRPTGSWQEELSGDPRLRGLGGVVKDTPAAVSWGPERIDLFCRGTDDRLMHAWLDGDSWNHWRSEPVEGPDHRIDKTGMGRIIAAPAAASWAEGRLDVFARVLTGEDITRERLGHWWWDGGDLWHVDDPLDLLEGGLQVVGAPAAVSSAPNTIDCFVTSITQQIAHMSFR